MHNTNSTNEVNEQRVTQIRNILGPDVVLLDCQGKKPSKREWQRMVISEMTPAYLRRLEKGRNIGALLGKNSNRLCALDIDHDAEVEPFLDRYPFLRQSASNRGARGRKIFVRIVGHYPGKTKLYRDGEVIGDWLADGCQAILDGLHPDSGIPYRWECTDAPAAINFSELEAAIRKHPAPNYSSESTELPEHTEHEPTEHTELLNNIYALDKLRDRLSESEPFFKAYELFVEPRYMFRAGQRNSTIVKAVTFLFRAFGEAEIQQLMTWLYQLNADVCTDSLEQHTSEVRAHLVNCGARYVEELSDIEHAHYVRLNEGPKAAFRICRDLALRSMRPKIFFLSCNELAGRLRKQSMEAYRILHRFQRLKIIDIVTPGIRGIGSRVATEWRWMLPTIPTP